MKAKDIKIGAIYTAKVSREVVRVKILEQRVNWRGRTYWVARNLDTGRRIEV